MPAEALTVALTPIQDLHGYNHPWAGGAYINLFDGEIEQGGIDTGTGTDTPSTTASRSKNYTPLTVGQAYYYQKNTGSYGFYIYLYDSSKNFIRLIDGDGTGGTFTPQSGEVYARFRWNTGDVSVISNTEIMLSKGTTRQNNYTPYENICPISGRTGTSVASVPKAEYAPFFEGVKNGTYGFVDLGSLEWNKPSTTGGHYRFRASLTDVGKAHTNAETPNAICPPFGIITPNDSYNASADGITTGSDGASVFVYSSVYESKTAQEFTTAMNGVYLIYELATPTTETADPYTEIINTDHDGTEEWIDNRDVPIPVGHESEYREEVNAVPVSVLGTDESNRTTASRAYTSGEYFYQNGKMYKATTSIASGATFTVGTNCVQTTLFAELKAAQN